MKLKSIVYFFSVLITILIGCKKSTSQKQISSVYGDILNYVEDKKVTTFFNKEDKNLIVGSAFDSLSTKGIFQIVYFDKTKPINKLYNKSLKSLQQEKLLSKYKQVLYFFEMENTDKVPSRYVEGKSEGWEYDFITPCQVKVFKWANGKWKYDTSIKVDDADTYYELRNNSMIQSKTSSIGLFKGIYNTMVDYGKLDEFSSAIIGYTLKVSQDSITLLGQGYKTNFYDLYYTKEVNDTLEVFYKKSLEGTDYNKNENSHLLKLYKKSGKFYGTSPIINDGQEVLFEKD